MCIGGWIGVFALLGNSPWATAAATASNADTCDDAWSRVALLQPLPHRLASWQTLGSKCGKSGLYEVRLAGLLTLLGRYDDARNAVRTGLALDTPYEKQLLSAGAAVELNAMRLGDAERQYRALITSYPDYYDGYCGMGALMLMKRNIPEAVRYLNEATQHEHVWIIYRHLTVAYAQLHEWQRAVAAFSNAYQLNPQVIGDRDSAYAAALSLMYLGKFRLADGTIKLLLKANPAAAADPQVQRSERTIEEKLQAGAPN